MGSNHKRKWRAAQGNQTDHGVCTLICDFSSQRMENANLRESERIQAKIFLAFYAFVEIRVLIRGDSRFQV